MMPNRIHTRVCRGFSMGSAMAMGVQSLNYLTHALSSWDESTPDPLNGRVPVKYMTLPETGPVVIKSYRRGGVIATLVKDRYLRTGKTRSQREFQFLCYAARAGVSVPRPLIYITRGYPLYRAWLVTQEIKAHKSFATLAMEDPVSAEKLMPLISENIKRLIKNKIFHVDLHPGNILIDDTKTPYIIDFDRARFTLHSTRKTFKLIHIRWKKSISRHHLPTAILNLELD